METIWIIRHGQSTLNEKKQFSGTTECRLTKKGRQTEKKIGAFFKERKISFETVYVSPQDRAIQSAEIIGRKLGINKMKIIKEKRLREQNFGIWEKKTRKEIEKKEEGIVSRWLLDPYNIKPENGEDYNDLEYRLSPFIKKILNSKEKTVLIVTHANIIKVMAKLLFLPRKIDIITLNVMHNVIYKFSVKEKKLQTVPLLKTGKKQKAAHTTLCKKNPIEKKQLILQVLSTVFRPRCNFLNYFFFLKKNYLTKCPA